VVTSVGSAVGSVPTPDEPTAKRTAQVTSMRFMGDNKLLELQLQRAADVFGASDELVPYSERAFGR